MAKKSKKPPAGGRPGVEMVPAEPPSVIDLTPAPDAARALELRDEALALEVSDRESHRAGLEFVKDAKEIQRRIAEYWKTITRRIDAAKTGALRLKALDIGPADDAVREATERVLAYEDEEKRRTDEKREEARRAAEAKAREDRDAEAKRLEADALEREASTDGLSERERVFVEAMAASRFGGKDEAYHAATNAGYRDPLKQSIRLMKTPKILEGIRATREARVLKEQAGAVRAQPPAVAPTPDIRPEIATAPGVRHTESYTGECFNPMLLLHSILERHGASRAILMQEILEVFEPSEKKINAKARQLRQTFERAFPGCRLIVKKSIAG